MLANMMTVFDVLAESRRRAILDLVRDGERSVGELVAALAMSQPAVSKHLRVLREAGLVRDELVGRQRLYSIDPAPLREIASWIGQFEPPESGWATWERRFDALETEVARTRRHRSRQSADQHPTPGITEESA
jgi:DNA-binding transcriptional ArsR family regulator